MQDERPETEPEEETEVEAHRFKPAPSEDPGRVAARSEDKDDDEVEAHRFKQI
jgi:hypothetical protein